MEICVWDIETAGGFKADYSSVSVVAIKPLGKTPLVKSVKRIGDDRELCVWARETLERFNIWVGFNTKWFDIRFLRGRLAFHKEKDIQQRFHIDMYHVLKNVLAESSNSMANYAALFNLEEQKMKVSPQIWSQAPFKPENLEILKTRCASDTKVLEHLYQEYKYLIKNITK